MKKLKKGACGSFFCARHLDDMQNGPHSRLVMTGNPVQAWRALARLEALTRIGPDSHDPSPRVPAH